MSNYEHSQYCTWYEYCDTTIKRRLKMKTISQLAAFAFVLFLTSNAQAAVIFDQSNA